MNKLKRMTAVLCSLVMSFSLIAMPVTSYASDLTVYAEASSEKANMNTVQWYKQGNGWLADGIVNMYDWQGHLETAGWDFSEEIAGDSSTNFEIKFDYNAVSPNPYATAALGISGETLNGWDSTPRAYQSGYLVFKIGALDGDKYTLTSNEYLEGTELTKNTWYTVTTTVSIAGELERTVIEERESGTVIKDTDWQALRIGTGAWETDKAYDKIRFTVNNGPTGHIQLDNVSVKEAKIAMTPKVTASIPLDVSFNENDAFSVATAGIKVKFSADMDEESLNADGVVTLCDEEGSEVALTKTLGKANELIISIDELLAPNTKYTLKITTDALSSEGVALENEYIEEFDTTVNTLVFEADFDNTNPKAVDFENDATEVNAVVAEDEDGNKYVELTALKPSNLNSWQNYGYKFDKPLGSQTYKIAFDFVPKELSAYDSLTLASGEKIKTVTWKEEFGLVNWVNNAVAVDDASVFSGISQWDSEKWYSYEMILNNSAKTFTVTITDREDPENVATGKGTVPANNGYYGLNMRAGAKMYLDNIIVEAISAKPQSPNPAFIKADGAATTDAKNVSPATEKIELDFGELMNLRSFDGNISFTNQGNGQDVYYSLTSQGTKVYLEDLDLKAGEKYSLSISGSVVSIYGDAVGSDVNVEFKVKDAEKEISLVPLDVKFKDLTDTSVKINAINTTDEDIKGKLLISYLDENGKIIEFYGVNVAIASMTDGTKEIPVSINPEAKAKAQAIEFMLWENLKDAKPMCDYFEIVK